MLGKIIALLVILAPTLVIIWNRFLSKKAQARRRQAKESEDAQAHREKHQIENRTDAEAHDRQDEAQSGWKPSDR